MITAISILIWVVGIFTIYTIVRIIDKINRRYTDDDMIAFCVLWPITLPVLLLFGFFGFVIWSGKDSIDYASEKISNFVITKILKKDL